MTKRIIAGLQSVREALRAGTEIRSLHVDSKQMLDEISAAATDRGIKVQLVDKRSLDAMSDGVRNQGVVAIAAEYQYWHPEDLIRSDRRCLIALDEVSDPHNLGAIVRTGVALGVDGFLVPKHRAAHITPTVVRTSAGATEHAAIAMVTNLQRTLDALVKQDWRVLGLDGEGSIRLDDVQLTETSRVVLVVGAEGSGLRRMVRERCTDIVRIDLPGPIESLNASVAAAIAIHHVVKRIGAPNAPESSP